MAAGTANASSLDIIIGSGGAGTVAGTATIALASDGTGVDSLGTTALASQTITVTGTINNYATTAVQALSGPGTLSGSGTTLHLNLGSTAVGSAALTENLGVLNGAAAGPADVLSGSFGLSGSTLYTGTGFGTFSGLTAGGTADTAPTISLGTGTAGTFAETIVVHGTGPNASGYSGTVSNETIVVSGTITAAPMTFIAATAAAPQTAAAPLTGAAAANAFTIAVSTDANAKPEALSLLSEPAYTPSTLAAAGHAATDLTPHPEGTAHNVILAPWS